MMASSSSILLVAVLAVLATLGGVSAQPVVTRRQVKAYQGADNELDGASRTTTVSLDSAPVEGSVITFSIWSMDKWNLDSAPSGFTLLDSLDSKGAKTMQMHTYYKIAGAAESTDFSFGESDSDGKKTAAWIAAEYSAGAGTSFTFQQSNFQEYNSAKVTMLDGQQTTPTGDYSLLVASIAYTKSEDDVVGTNVSPFTGLVSPVRTAGTYLGSTWFATTSNSPVTASVEVVNSDYGLVQTFAFDINVDCVGAFSPYGDCSVSCGSGTQDRTHSISQSALNAGAVCSATPLTQSCDEGVCPPADVDCVGSYGQYGTCSETCGDGVQLRVWTTTVAQQGGGAACADSDTVQACNLGDCAAPVDCVGVYESYGTCSTTCGPGLKSRTFTISQQALNGGTDCDGSALSAACNVAVCPGVVDCQGEFSDWSTCSATCGEGIRNRSFTVTQIAENGGLACDGLPIVEACNDGPCPGAVDCVVDFSTWSSCTETCGIGTRSRTATITTPAENGGLACVTTPISEVCNDGPCANDCVGVFSQWAACSFTCGGGTQDRTFTVTTPATNGGAACDATPLQRPCTNDPCPINCDGTHSAWGTCSQSCGVGTRSRDFTETVAAQYGGLPCVTSPLTEVCEIVACPGDCAGTFSDWSDCSQPCGPGTQTRTFTVTTPAVNGGASCLDTPLSQSCEIIPCPIDCVGSFSDYGPCSATCGLGIHVRTHSITTPAQYGGDACVTSPLSDVCQDVECPIDCVGSFSNWSPCSVTCGPGTRTRIHTVTTPAQFNGAPCIDTPLTGPCLDVECPIDCQGSFDDWGPCSRTCGDGIRTRAFVETQAALYGGTPCVTTPVQQECNDQSCPINCQGNFSAWGLCSSSCGAGTQARTFTVTTPAQFGGDVCVSTPQAQVCQAGGCPVDCFGRFSSWSACSVSCGPLGTQTRTFTQVTAARFGGAQCITTPVVQSCPSPSPCPVDCAGAFASWSACSATCGPGSQSREFLITTEADHGGLACVDSDEVQPCNIRACPIDCQQVISSWGECSKSCDSGIRTRTLTITVPAQFGGVQCAVPPTSEICNPQSCPAPGDCIGSFSDWSQCSQSCGGGTRSRTFTINTAADPKGKPCIQTPLTESCQTQFCPIDCVGSFTDYQACSVSCGPGIQNRFFETTVQAQHGGIFCVDQPTTRTCNEGACPIDCVGSFGMWSSCSSTCGAGTQTRTFTQTVAAANGGAACVTTPISQACTVGECPVDCQQTVGSWSDCSKPCNGGTRIRDVTVTVPAQFGGALCVDTLSSETCNTDPCPDPVDCLGQYTPFNECSVSCGPGTRSREFTITNPARNGGTCEQVLTEPCGEGRDCDVDCEEAFSEWSACSVSCGAGIQSRKYTEITAAVANGVPCTADPIEARPCPDSPECQISGATVGDGGILDDPNNPNNPNSSTGDATKEEDSFPIMFVVIPVAVIACMAVVGIIVCCRKRRMAPMNHPTFPPADDSFGRATTAAPFGSLAGSSGSGDFNDNSDTSDSEDSESSSSSASSSDCDSDGSVVYM